MSVLLRVAEGPAFLSPGLTGGGLIGWGVFNPHSMYRVRLLATSEPSLLEHRDVGALLRERLSNAQRLRAALALPSELTSAYRLVNSEGDRLSGLTVDVFGPVAVAVSSALWLEQRRDEVTSALLDLPGIDEVVWRRSDGRLQQDGWESPRKSKGSGSTDAPPPRDTPLSEGSGGAPATPKEKAAAAAARRAESEVEVTESGLRFLVAPALGQKSGFYCDQRDNRRWLAAACRGKTVLDLFCYSGGFAISAAAAGATACVGVDSSAFALELAARNAALNGVDGSCTFVQADVHKYLKGDAGGQPRGEGGSGGGGGGRDGLGEGRSGADGVGGGGGGGGAEAETVAAGGYDVVICDPPKLAPSVKDLPRATRKYKQLNGGAMRAISPAGGMLMSFTYSQQRRANPGPDACPYPALECALLRRCAQCELVCCSSLAVWPGARRR